MGRPSRGGWLCGLLRRNSRPRYMRGTGAGRHAGTMVNHWAAPGRPDRTGRRFRRCRLGLCCVGLGGNRLGSGRFRRLFGRCRGTLRGFDGRRFHRSRGSLGRRGGMRWRNGFRGFLRRRRSGSLAGGRLGHCGSPRRRFASGPEDSSARSLLGKYRRRCRRWGGCWYLGGHSCGSLGFFRGQGSRLFDRSRRLGRYLGGFSSLHFDRGCDPSGSRRPDPRGNFLAAEFLHHRLVQCGKT